MLSSRTASLGLPDECALWADPTTAVLIPTTTDAAGLARLPLRIPNNSTFSGLSFAAQGITVDAINSLGLSLTAGLLLTLGN